VKFCQLTSRKVKALQAKKKPGYYADGSGVYLQISRYGTSSWVFRYTLDGRVRDMGMGSAEIITLRGAREMAREFRQQLISGEDPLALRNAKKEARRAEEAKRKTFIECADAYIAAHSGEWRSSKHVAQWRSSLEMYAYPVLGKLPVDAIELPHILNVLEPIWREKRETASRLRGRIERILAWATVRRYRKGDNPAKWEHHLDELLPKIPKDAQKKHHAALPLGELGGFMAELRARTGTVTRALEFTILTASRSGEVRGARWDEVDLKEAVWVIPADRMKSNRAHRVPLSDRAVKILRDMHRENEYVFPGARGPRMSTTAMLELTWEVGGKDLTVHGFRSCFSDWCRDQTSFSRDVVEMALAHTIKDKSEAAYRRLDALDKRRRLMEQWSRFLMAPRVTAKVTPLRGGA
jgi:integrase